MMTKKRTSSIAAIKLLLVVPVTIIVFLAISAYKYDNILSFLYLLLSRHVIF